MFPYDDGDYSAVNTALRYLGYGASPDPMRSLIGILCYLARNPGYLDIVILGNIVLRPALWVTL